MSVANAPLSYGAFEITVGSDFRVPDPQRVLAVDVQTEAFDWRDEFLEPRVWTIDRWPPAPEAVARAVALIGSAQRPLMVAGGGVIYSEATEALRAFVDATQIPVCETQAGRGALLSDHPLSLGAVGATGSASRQPAGAPGRPGDRDRNALEGFHDRVEVRLPRSGRALRQRDGWWEVPVAEVSEDPHVQSARAKYVHDRVAQRHYLQGVR